MTTWRKEIEIAMKYHHETYDDVVFKWPEDGWEDEEFDDDYGVTHGRSFTLWTTKRVYFPVEYDGREWASSVPRDPCKVATIHQGGG